jgi:NDP-sugar pyrophosphorylase family protein
VGLATLDDLIGAVQRPNWVVLMAGGLGTRLQPLTRETPKPLLPVGGKPILETILESFAEEGFKRFFLSVNYKAEMIQEHFGSGERWGVRVDYLHERERMAVRDYDIRVPYGVVRLDGARIEAIEEKPTRSFFVNAGIYVLSPEALDLLQAGTACDMPELFERVMASGRTTAAFPLREYWIDVGRMEEFERANREWVSDER